MRPAEAQGRAELGEGEAGLQVAVFELGVEGCLGAHRGGKGGVRGSGGSREGASEAVSTLSGHSSGGGGESQGLWSRLYRVGMLRRPLWVWGALRNVTI